MTSPPGLDLSPRQKQLIRESFESLTEYSDSVVLLFYGRLFELAPKVRTLFKPDLREQSRKLLDTLTLLVKALDRFEQLRGELLELGARHSNYDVQPEHYQFMINALIWTFGQALGAEFDRATRTAWEQLLNVVSAAMLEGAAPGTAAPVQ